MKMTRKQIREGLEQVPIETVLLGVGDKGGVTLTAKQKRFAEELVNGETKAGAYRKAYNSKGKPNTASRRGQELAKNGAVMAYADRLKMAREGERLRTPAFLRSWIIHELTERVTDPEVGPAQQIKALELLGKITEVALFTERREIVRVDNADKAKAALLDSIHAAMKARSTDVEYRDALSLIDEIRGGANEIIESEALPGAHPPSEHEAHPTPLHSNPHIQSPANLDPKNPGTQSDVFSNGDDRA